MGATLVLGAVRAERVWLANIGQIRVHSKRIVGEVGPWRLTEFFWQIGWGWVVVCRGFIEVRVDEFV